MFRWMLSSVLALSLLLGGLLPVAEAAVGSRTAPGHTSVEGGKKKGKKHGKKKGKKHGKRR